MITGLIATAAIGCVALVLYARHRRRTERRAAYLRSLAPQPDTRHGGKPRTVAQIEARLERERRRSRQRRSGRQPGEVSAA